MENIESRGNATGQIPGRSARRHYWIAPALLGIFALLNVSGDPRLAALRGGDMVRLIGVGMCFGAALGLFFYRFRMGLFK